MNDVYFKASSSSNKHYLDTIGLTSLWSKIKSIFATKTELASKANIGDLSNFYTKSEVDNLLSNIGSGTEGGDDTQGGLSFYTAVERAPGYDGTSQMNISEDYNTVEDE